jgi:hypothetical protein
MYKSNTSFLTLSENLREYIIFRENTMESLPNTIDNALANLHRSEYIGL